MSFKEFCSYLFKNVCALENKMSTGFRFSQSEINEILNSSKKENIKYFETLAKMPKLSAFDIGFLLSSTNLSEDKIEILKKAQSMYKEEEFKAHGQTFSDFVFRVGANIDKLSMDNLEIFKELVQCKNEIYDFSKALDNPIKYTHMRKKEPVFAFRTVLVK